jgi:nicotinate phosphoribosyltransferase
MIERNAYIGGCDGVAVVKSGEIIGEDPMGTMPHALIICMGSTVKAIKAYDKVLEPKFKRVVLIDTFLDEKFEAINVAEAMGKKLFAMRLDTPSSRRGDFFRILQEVRWELDLRGYRDIKLFVSMDIMEVNGRPFAKRGKWSGSKRVLRCQRCNTPRVVQYSRKRLKCECGGPFRDVLLPFRANEKILHKCRPAKDIRSFVLQQVNTLDL